MLLRNICLCLICAAVWAGQGSAAVTAAFDATPLRAVLDHLGRTTDLSIDTTRLTAIHLDAPVTWEGRRVPAREALEAVCAAAHCRPVFRETGVVLEPLAALPGTGVIAVVNGIAIDHAAVNDRLRAIIGAAPAPGTDLPTLKANTLMLMVRELVERAIAARLPAAAEPPPDAVAALLARHQAFIRGQPDRYDGFAAYLRRTGHAGEADYIAGMIVPGLTIDWHLTAQVTEHEARDWFGTHPSRFDADARVRASHILIPAGTDAAADVAARAQAEELLFALKRGADFPDFARRYSTCPSAADGGDLGFFPRGRMLPEFEAAAFALSPGTIGGPIRTPAGWHIIKVTGTRPARGLEAVREDVIADLVATRRGELLRAELAATPIEIVNPAFKDALTVRNN